MTSQTNQHSFIQSFGIRKNDVACLIGAGGKTSLMFTLARQASKEGFKVLVTTSTRILVPEPDTYDAIDLSGKLFTDQPVTKAGIYVGGIPDNAEGKMRGVRDDLLNYQKKQFDLILIEADGAATKPLKGWNEAEPVIPDSTSITIGVVDIQTIGKIINESLVHRLEIFTSLTGCEEGDPFSLGHLLRLIVHEEGLFAKSQGMELLYINKVESADDRRNTDRLRQQIENLKIVAGSVHTETIHE